MVRSITVRQLNDIVAKGAVIRWCGAIEADELLVELTHNGKSWTYHVDVDTELESVGHNGVIRNGEADEPMEVVGPIPPNTDFFAVLRKASVLGINIGGTCESGSGKMYDQVDGCTCGYDIELDLRGQERGGFPLPSVPVLSCALWCSCGWKMFITTMDCDLEDTIANCTQESLVSATVGCIRQHKPLWLVGWNCYSFDNTCLAYHASDDLVSMFKRVKVGSAGDVDYGYIMNIEGVYNVDAFSYLQRNPGHSSKLPDLSLYGVAKALGTTLKTDMPDLYAVSSPPEIRDYNMNDSAVTVEIWLKMNLPVEIPSLALCACAPVYDCIRYMTGAMAACALSSDAVEADMVIDWSRCERELRYEGGKVVEPIRGVHKDVVVCDFSSMYPTIMVDARISPEVVEIREAEGRAYGSVWYDDEKVYVELDDHVASFPRHGTTIQRDGLIKATEMRNRHKKSNPTYAGALKVVSNSAYGAMGYTNSPMYSPSCSSSVTAIGRWCLNLAISVFAEYGMNVVYGDTDSVFVAATAITTSMYNGDVTEHAKSCLTELHKRLGETPFKGMKMELESTHDRILLVDKKHYCKTDGKGKVSYKGLSVVRRDKLGLSKAGCRAICEALLLSPTIEDGIEEVARVICNIVSRAAGGALSAMEVSKVAKRDQKRCYVYNDKNGEERAVPIDMAANHTPEYDVKYVLTSLKNEIERISVPCGLGTVYDIVTRSHVFI
jgi:DNA polymerase elongation subunit (family B)